MSLENLRLWLALVHAAQERDYGLARELAERLDVADRVQPVIQLAERRRRAGRGKHG